MRFGKHPPETATDLQSTCRNIFNHGHLIQTPAQKRKEGKAGMIDTSMTQGTFP